MREFFTYDNGARAFRAVIDDDARMLRAYGLAGYDPREGRKYSRDPVYVLEFEHVFIGAEGCAILALSHAGRRAHFIGHEICEFTLRDEDKFVSFEVRAGCSDTPYPWVECTRNTYLMLEPVYLPNYTRGSLDRGNGSTYDPYSHYYGVFGGESCPARFADDADFHHIGELARIGDATRAYFEEHFPFAREVIARDDHMARRANT